MFESLSRLFTKSFEVYLKPILRWIEVGGIHSSQESTFIETTTQEVSLPSLWHRWYKLKQRPDSSRTPRFMQHFIEEIFIIGKTKVFLHNLSNAVHGRYSEPVPLASTETLSMQVSSLTPFSEALEAVITQLIRVRHQSSFTELREKLNHECGLWRTLDALHSIYLGRSGCVLDGIDTRIFDRIDQGNRAWNDRYLLTELWRNAFQGLERIDTDWITVQAGRSSSRNMQSQRRPVRVLEDITLHYSLPWPIANIVLNGALQIYKHISTFLLQIRRARYVLGRRCRVAVRNEKLYMSFNKQRLAQKLHCQLLIFVNYLYSHLILFVIEHATNEMCQALTVATDVDGMIRAHQRYVSKLEEMCLVSRRVRTVGTAVTLILDLCIRCSDIVTSPLGRRCSASAQSFKSAASRL